MNIQRLAWVCFRRVESDALDRAWRLHGAQYLFFFVEKEVVWHLSVLWDILFCVAAVHLYYSWHGISKAEYIFNWKISFDKYIAMAYSGGDFGYEDPFLDHDIDNDGYDDDYDQEEVDTTRPFQPGAASTPHQGGEQYEMQTMMHEQSGLPDTSYEETPFLRRAGSINDLQLESEIRKKN